MKCVNCVLVSYDNKITSSCKRTISNFSIKNTCEHIAYHVFVHEGHFSIHAISTFFCFFFAGQFSPVTSTKRPHPHPPSSPAHDHAFSSQSTSRLEVPQLFLPGVRSQNNFRHLHHHRRVPPHSTSSSPSTSSQSSPCLTPMSPRSPLDPHSGFNNLHRSVAIVLSTDENSTDEEEEEGEEEAEFYEGSEGFMSDSSNSSFNDGGVVGPARHPGLQLPTRGIAAQSLPNLLMSERHHGRGGGGGNGEGMYATSEDNLQSWYNRKPSLSGTISTADSKTSTLVGSIMVRERERERERRELGGKNFSLLSLKRGERERERGERGGRGVSHHPPLPHSHLYIKAYHL